VFVGRHPGPASTPPIATPKVAAPVRSGSPATALSRSRQGRCARESACGSWSTKPVVACLPAAGREPRTGTSGSSCPGSASEPGVDEIRRAPTSNAASISAGPAVEAQAQPPSARTITRSPQLRDSGSRASRRSRPRPPIGQPTPTGPNQAGRFELRVQTGPQVRRAASRWGGRTSSMPHDTRRPLAPGRESTRARPRDLRHAQGGECLGSSAAPVQLELCPGPRRAEPRRTRAPRRPSSSGVHQIPPRGRNRSRRGVFLSDRRPRRGVDVAGVGRGRSAATGREGASVLGRKPLGPIRPTSSPGAQRHRQRRDEQVSAERQGQTRAPRGSLRR